VPVAAREPVTGVAGMVTTDVEVPPFAGGVSLSGVVLTSLPSALLVTRGQTRLASALGTPPTAARGFYAGDRIVAAVEAYVPASGEADRRVTADVERLDGGVVLHHEERLPAGGGRARTSEIRVPIDTALLPPGRYLLRIRLDGAQPPGAAERRVPFEVVAEAEK